MPGTRLSPSDVKSELITGHFDQGRGYGMIREHGTADWLLIYTVRGKGRFGYRRGEIIAEPGDAVLHRPGTYHDYGVEPTLSHWELAWTHVLPRPESLELLDWPEEAPGLMRLRIESPDARRSIQRQFALVHQHAQGGGRRGERYAMNALELLLLDLDAHNPRSAQARIDARVRAAMDWMARNLEARIVLDDLAEHVGLSVSRLAHLFKDEVGSTPQQFLEHRRMRRAQQLLALTSRPIQEIAAEVGFESAFYFSSRFRKHAGASPRDYRRRHGTSRPADGGE
ncbi:MAG TPA: helix-turn-helix domain-containing protein [Planctomycetota bacterium]|nr:helix-turn-helix domain-containing protein [Planctomycetota bacterium]